MTGIRNKRWQWRKMMPLFWLHQLHAPSLVSIGQNKLKLLSYWVETEFLFLVTVTLTLITDTWVAIQSCLLLLATHTPSLVSISQNKLKLFSGNRISIFSYIDLDLDHRQLGSNPKLRLDVSYLYSKFGVNRPKQTKVIERKLNFYL